MLKTLPDTDIEQLRRLREKFESLDPALRQEYRRLHQQLHRHERGSQLLNVLQRYHRWLLTLSDAERADLLDLPPDQRIGRIREIQRQQEARSLQDLAVEMQPADGWILAEFFRGYVAEHREEIAEQLPAKLKNAIADEPRTFRQTQLLMGAMAHFSDSIQLPPLDREEFNAMLQRLSPEARRHLAAVGTGEELVSVLAERMQAIRRNVRSRMDATPGQLREFYDSLPAKDRERLDRLPPDEAQMELRRLIRQRRGRSPSGPRPRRPGRPRPEN